jgi:hypothetical protein
VTNRSGTAIPHPYHRRHPGDRPVIYVLGNHEGLSTKTDEVAEDTPVAKRATGSAALRLA